MATGFSTTQARWLLVLFVLFLFAALLRTGYFWVVRDGLLGNGDSLAYEDLAQKLLSHQPYASTANAGPGGFPTDLQRPPGYPAFLAIVDALLGPSRMNTAVVQCVLSAAFAVVLAVLVAAFTTELTGLLAGFLYALDWVTIVHVPMTVSDPLFTVLLGAAICLYALSMAKQRGSLALAAGFLLGVAALVKPIGQVVVLAFLLGWLMQEKRRAAGLLFLVSYLACVAPWMARNYHQHGVATLSAIGTVDLYFYVGEASARPHSVTELSGSALNDDVTRISKEWASQPLTPSEREQAMETRTLVLITQHWPMVAYQTAVGFSRTCFGTGAITVANSVSHPLSRTMRVSLAIVPLLEVLTLWLLAAIGAFTSNPASNVTRAMRGMLIGCVVLLVLPASSTMGQSRFRTPVVPVLAILGAMGAEKLWQQRRRLSPVGSLKADRLSARTNVEFHVRKRSAASCLTLYRKSALTTRVGAEQHSAWGRACAPAAGGCAPAVPWEQTRL